MGHPISDVPTQPFYFKITWMTENFHRHLVSHQIRNNVTLLHRTSKTTRFEGTHYVTFTKYMGLSRAILCAELHRNQAAVRV